MSNNAKKWLGLSIFNTLICIIVCTIMIVVSSLSNTTFIEIIIKIILALSASVEATCTYICWDKFLLEQYNGR